MRVFSGNEGDDVYCSKYLCETRMIAKRLKGRCSVVLWIFSCFIDYSFLLATHTEN